MTACILGFAIYKKIGYNVCSFILVYKWIRKYSIKQFESNTIRMESSNVAFHISLSILSLFHSSASSSLVRSLVLAESRGAVTPWLASNAIYGYPITLQWRTHAFTWYVRRWTTFYKNIIFYYFTYYDTETSHSQTLLYCVRWWEVSCC